MAMHIRGPMLVERQIEGIDGDARSRQILKRRSIQQRPEPGIPRLPVPAVATFFGRTTVSHSSIPAVAQDVQVYTMLMSQTIPREFFVRGVRQAVGIHLRDERQMIGQREIPDVKFDWKSRVADSNCDRIHSHSRRVRNGDFAQHATSLHGAGQHVFLKSV